MCMVNSWRALAVCVLLVTPAGSIMFDLPSGKVKCFSEDLPGHTMVVRMKNRPLARLRSHPPSSPLPFTLETILRVVSQSLCHPAVEIWRACAQKIKLEGELIHKHARTNISCARNLSPHQSSHKNRRDRRANLRLIWCPRARIACRLRSRLLTLWRRCSSGSLTPYFIVCACTAHKKSTFVRDVYVWV